MYSSYITLKKSFIILFFFLALAPAPVYTAEKITRVKILKVYNESLETHISGTEKTAPPFVKVLRSNEGLNHLFKIFKQIKNYQTFKRIKWLKKSLASTNFNKKILIAILTAPTDNYYMKFEGLHNVDNEYLRLKISYLHKENISYKITPKKSIFYKILLINKTSLPVVLKATNITEKDKKAPKKIYKYIYGKLYAGQNGEVRLVSSKTRKGKIYYLSGDILDELKKHIGKKITLSGRVSETHEGPYEANFKVIKIIKIHK